MRRRIGLWGYGVVLLGLRYYPGVGRWLVRSDSGASRKNEPRGEPFRPVNPAHSSLESFSRLALARQAVLCRAACRVSVRSGCDPGCGKCNHTLDKFNASRWLLRARSAGRCPGGHVRHDWMVTRPADPRRDELDAGREAAAGVPELAGGVAATLRARSPALGRAPGSWPLPTGAEVAGAEARRVRTAPGIASG